MIKELQAALNSLGEKLVVDGIPGPMTKAALARHPIVAKWHQLLQNDKHQLAYILATAWHETAFTLKPIREMGGEDYLKSKSYYPWVGMGYPQLTWPDNYAKFCIKNDPTKAMDPEYSAFIIIVGMLLGAFTGRKLSDYFTGLTADAVSARAIINGTDKAQEIAGYYNQFLAML